MWFRDSRLQMKETNNDNIIITIILQIKYQIIIYIKYNKAAVQKCNTCVLVYMYLLQAASDQIFLG